MYIPEDPNMLVSMINMKLRDEYGSLDELCLSLGIDEDDLRRRLADAGFIYNAEARRFV